MNKNNYGKERSGNSASCIRELGIEMRVDEEEQDWNEKPGIRKDIKKLPTLCVL